MNDNRGTTVLLTVIGIATLLVAVVGATFAFFTANVKDSEGSVDTDVTVTAANLGTIIFDHGKTLELGTVADPAYPGDSASNSFKVETTGSTVDVDYVVTMDVNSTFVAPVDENGVTKKDGEGNDLTNTNLRYKVWTSNSTATDKEGNALATTQEAAQWIYIPADATTLTLGKAVLAASGADATTTDTWNILVELEEIGEAQNYDQNRTLTGVLSVEAATEYTTNGTVYNAG